ncbi:MAG: PD40 domain-containing protein [Armatimonadetes bacterium]|nr:PD40 domain-containing protein [Armatimonadota bacterium]
MATIRNRHHGLLALLLLALLGFALPGCGGGGGGGGGGAQTGTVEIQVDWPSRAQNVPKYANSVKATITDGSNQVSVVLNRSGDTGYTGTVSFPQAITVGTHNMAIAAYTNTNGNGDIVATGNRAVTVTAGQKTTALLSADFNSTVHHVVIDGEPILVTTGNSAQLLGHAENASNATLLLPSSAFTWTVTAGGSFGSVTSSGLFTGIADGTVTVQMTEAYSGMSDTAAVTVTPASGQGNVNVKVDWPSRGRYVPPYAESVKATITFNSTPYTVTINRSGDTGSQGSAQFAQQFDIGTYPMVVDAYTQTNGGGTRVATATVNVSVFAGQTAQVNVSGNLQSLIDHLVIENQPLSLAAGQQLQLVGHAENAANATLLLPSGALTWSVTSGASSGSVTLAGLFTAGNPGTATVQLAEVGAGKSQTANVTVLGALPPNKIFYSLFNSGNLTTDLAYMDPNGANRTPIFSLPLNITVATLSPDGQHWAFFYSPDPLSANAVYDVYINTTPSFAGATRITSANYTYDGTIQYTSDGTQLVYTASPTLGDSGLYKVNASGGSPTRLGGTANIEAAHLSYATNKIVCTRVVSGLGEIATINLDGTGLTNITSNTSDDIMPQWNKAGTRVAFSTDRNGDFDIYTMTSTGTGVTRVTNVNLDEYGPTYDDGGTNLAFAVIGGDLADYGVYTCTSTGASRTQILSDQSIGAGLYWSSLTGRASGGIESYLFGRTRRGHRR